MRALDPPACQSRSIDRAGSVVAAVVRSWISSVLLGTCVSALIKRRQDRLGCRHRGLCVLTENRLRLSRPRRQDGQHKGQHHEDAARGPRCPRQHCRRLSATEDPVRCCGATTHGRKTAALARLEQDHDAEKNPVEYQNCKQ
jgi:hypothetical protein